MLTMWNKDNTKCIPDKRRLALCIHDEVKCPYLIDEKYCSVLPYMGDELKVAWSCKLENDLLANKRRLSRQEYFAVLDGMPFNWLEEYMARRRLAVEDWKCKRGEVKE